MKDNLNILFASDFSHGSRVALNNLKAIKKKLPVDISLLHVVSSFWKDWFSSGLYQKEAMQRLQSWQQELLETTDPKKLFVKVGSRTEVILSTAQALKTDLIALGSKDTQSKGRYKSGATVEGVVRYAKNSVLIFKNEQISKILCGIDGSHSSEKALNSAIQLAKHFNAEITLIFVMPKVNIDKLGIKPEEVLKKEKLIEKENVSKIEKFLERFDFLNVSVDKQFKWGTPSHVLLDMAEDFNYDLIAIGADGHGLLHHALIGSTAEKILRFAPCSLLVAR